jgi:hypothetical protein
MPEEPALEIPPTLLERLPRGSEFNARCERVDRQVRLAGYERATGRLLQAVARGLNEVDWRDRLDVTDDFRVYPWEIQGESLEDDLAASGPPSEG